MAFVTPVSNWQKLYVSQWQLAHRVNMCYSTREAVELMLNRGLDLDVFSDSGSEGNIVDSGEEFVPVDHEVDSSDNDNDLFIFMIGIRATSRIKK